MKVTLALYFKRIAACLGVADQVFRMLVWLFS